MPVRIILAVLALTVARAAAAHESIAALEAQVRATETAFARTLADRDLQAFRRFVAPDAVFVDNPVARGPDAIVAAWTGEFRAAQPPFSWAPETVVVIASGGLALSSGPVRAPDGHRIGTFASVWRREHDGHWRIVLDYGCPQCRCPPDAGTAPDAGAATGAGAPPADGAH